jgi:hypothetical protein
VELMPGEAAVFFNRAELFRERGEKEKAIADYSRAFNVAQESKFLTNKADVLFGRGLCHSQLGHFPEEEADVAEAVCLQAKPESLQLLEVIRQGLEILRQRSLGLFLFATLPHWVGRASQARPRGRQGEPVAAMAAAPSLIG